MSKSTRNTGKAWSPSDQRALRDLARQNTPTRVIGLKLGRTEGAVQSQAFPAGRLAEADEPVALQPPLEVTGRL